MKFLQFYRDGRPTLGVITEKGVVDMSAHPELPQTMLALCQSGDTAALAALDGPYLDEESLTLAPVVTGMEKILCIGLNYRAHAAECGIPLPESPTVFCKLPTALAAHDGSGFQLHTLLIQHRAVRHAHIYITPHAAAYLSAAER